MHLRAPVPQLETAYVAATQVALASAVRALLALEGDDPEVGAVVVECAQSDGGVQVTLLNTEGVPVGGYEL